MAKNEILSFIEKLKKELSDDSISISQLSDPANNIEIEPTGILALDRVCGGGFPRGRWVEIFGKESGGKSLLASLVCANAQRNGELVAWVDMERTADNRWFKRLGIDTDNMILVKPNSAEGAFKAMTAFIESGKFAYIVVDSVASMSTEDEQEDEPGKANMAVMARLLSTQMRVLTGKLDASKTTVILINQLRSTMAVTKYAQQETTTGGKAIPFYATLRLGVHRSKDPASYIKDENENYLAHTIMIKNIKNKLGSPDKRGEFMLIYDGGPDNRLALIAMALEKKYITQKAAMFYIDFNGQQISARGEKQLVQRITDNTELQKFLFEALNIPECYRHMFETNNEVLEATGLSAIAEDNSVN